MQEHPNDGIGYAARYVYLVMNLPSIYFAKMGGKKRENRKILFAKWCRDNMAFKYCIIYVWPNVLTSKY